MGSRLTCPVEGCGNAALRVYVQVPKPAKSGKGTLSTSVTLPAVFCGTPGLRDGHGTVAVRSGQHGLQAVDPAVLRRARAAKPKPKPTAKPKGKARSSGKVSRKARTAPPASEPAPATPEGSTSPPESPEGLGTGVPPAGDAPLAAAPAGTQATLDSVPLAAAGVA